MSDIYVPAKGKRIVMPGNRADWPEEGQPIDPIDPYQRRMLLDGDLILKPVPAEPVKPKS